MVGTISYFTGDKVIDELIGGYAPLLKEKGGSSVVAGVPQVYQTHDSSSLTNEKDHHYFLNSADVCWCVL